MSGEHSTKSDSGDRSRSSSDRLGLGDSSNGEKTRTISREQRSEAAKRGWVTRKKRKP